MLLSWPETPIGIARKFEQCGQPGIDDQDLDTTGYARNLFSIAKGDFGELDLEPPLPCAHPAPDLPNVWPDGSVKHPSQAIWSLGGFGVVQENRICVGNVLHPNEETYVHTNTKGNDLHMWGPLPGPMCSSTRTEIAGGLFPLYAPRPTHIASDSVNFVRVAHLLFAGLPLPKVFDKPWDLIPNGDLWKLFFEHARAKGLHSLRATWVKGHATQQHVRDGVTTEHNKTMNHTADSLADDGVGSYTSNLQPLAQVYCHRQHIYGKIICAIQTHIVCVHMFFKQLRDDKTKELQDQNKASEQHTNYSHNLDVDEVVENLEKLAPEGECTRVSDAIN